MEQPASVLSAWSFAADTDTSSLILPDGCCDLICRTRAGGAPEWFVFPLADRAASVTIASGTRYRGFRFLPGTRLDEARLLRRLAATPEPDARALAEWIDAFSEQGARAAEILAVLADAPSPAQARQHLGISERSLERWCRKETGRTAGFWTGLARVRRTAAALPGELPLAELADAHGFADQAHMNRAFRHWFGVTPARFRQSPELLAAARESGFGQPPTGVHNSTQNPSGSAT